MTAGGASLLWLYRAATTVASPLITRHLHRRLQRGREDPERIAERFGRTATPRPSGPLVWLHAASVGEVTTALPLIEQLRVDHPGLHLLLTSGTVTSAKVAAQRLPNGVLHQYVPIDTPNAVRRFYNHWRPTAGLFLESEIWPNLVYQARRNGVPLALVNARMSPASFKGWRRLPALARTIFGSFARILAQSPADLDRFLKLGSPHADCTGSLKYAAAPPPADPVDLSELQNAFASRPVWLAAATHDGEETLVIDAHRRVANKNTGLLTIIAPRHPNRGDVIAAMIEDHGLRVTRRAANQPPTKATDVYIADTIGEMGLWYRLSPVAFIGGSLVPHGGHNPIEAAKLNSAILTGPHTANFGDIIAEFRSAGALSVVTDAESLANTLTMLLADQAARDRQTTAARRLAESKTDVVRKILDALSPILRPAITGANP